MTGNTNSHSRTLNDEKSMELILDYNNMTKGLAMLNSEKEENSKESAAKKVEKASEMAKIKQPRIQKNQ